MIQNLLNIDNNNKPLDVILMNPPYGNHGHGIDEDFLYKTIQLANNIVSVQPLSWLITLKQNKKITELIDKYGIDITINNTFDSFDAGIIGQNAIQYINTTTNSAIVFNGKTFSKCSDVKIYSTDNFLETFAEKIGYNNEVNNSLQDNLNKNNTIGYYYIEVPKLRGHKSKMGHDPDFYTIISNNDNWLRENKIGIINAPITKNITFFSFRTNNELNNFINYIKTDFVRTCLMLTKFNMNLLSGRMMRSIPWFDFSDKVFSKTPREIDDYLFKKYNISDEIRKHIEEILPDYYNIR